MADPLTIGLMVASTAFTMIGDVAAGRNADMEAQFEAEQLEARGKEETARGSREAAEEHRQKRLALSRARAVGGASGSDRAYDLEGQIEQEGQYAALSALFEGENRAGGYRNQARGARYRGKIAKRAGYMNAIGSAISGASGMIGSDAGKSLLDKYG